MTKVLLIEDNRDISKNIQQYLELEWYSVDVCHDGADGIEKATQKKYDIILLDLMLPEVDGISIARRVMQKNPTPIIMITARETLTDRLTGFEVWAVDYLVKPFNLSELHARMKVHLWKPLWGNKESNTSDINMNICDIFIDTQRRSFIKNGEEVHLTQKEFLVIEKLLENRDRVVSRTEIIEYLWWGESLYSGWDNKLDVYISNIRSKLAKWIIITVKGVGYKIGYCGK